MHSPRAQNYGNQSRELVKNNHTQLTMRAWEHTVFVAAQPQSLNQGKNIHTHFFFSEKRRRRAQPQSLVNLGKNTTGDL
jgi:hypothetical protein